MPKQPKHVLTAEQIARSFVKTILRHFKKPVSLKTMQDAALALSIVHRPNGTDMRFTGVKEEATKPESIAKACRQLVSWNKILVVNGGDFCLIEYAPKMRSLDDQWH